jgi:glutathione S-transferase
MRLYDYNASGNCYKARLLLALLAKPYERVPIDIFAGDTLTPWYAGINPARETPALELDDGTIIVQSNAILWYLAEDSAFLSKTQVGRAQTLQWLMFEQEYVIPGIAAPRFWRLTGRGDEQTISIRVDHGRETLSRLDQHLGKHDYLVDEPSIADIAVFAYSHVAADAGLDIESYPAVRKWFTRIAALPNFIDDFVPYPANAQAGAGRSIYD